jgi:hypothetical protein
MFNGLIERVAEGGDSRIAGRETAESSEEM